MIMQGKTKDLVEEEGKLVTRIEERRKQEEILWMKK